MLVRFMSRYRPSTGGTESALKGRERSSRVEQRGFGRKGVGPRSRRSRGGTCALVDWCSGAWTGREQKGETRGRSMSVNQTEKSGCEAY